MERIGVVGCGLMGSGIAEVCARAGFDVRVVESDAGAGERGLERIERSQDKAVASEKIGEEASRHALGRIRLTTASTRRRRWRGPSTRSSRSRSTLRRRSSTG